MPRPLAVIVIPPHQRADAVLERRLRLPAQHAFGLTDLRPRRLYIGRMTSRVYDLCLFPDERLDEPNRIHQHNGGVGAQVNDVVPQRFEAGNRASCDIVHIGEVAGLLPVAIYLYRLSFADPLHESKETHIGPPGGTVDREIPQYRYVDPVQIVIGVAERLGSLFGRGVG